MAVEQKSHGSETNVAIVHLRWATMAAKTEENAHPLTDHKNRIALVHSGQIYNRDELYLKLARNNLCTVGSTDSELIALLIGYYLDKSFTLHDAIQKALRKLEGTWAHQKMSLKEPDSIILAKNGSTLLIGVG
jgi:glucosamine--fructose-6-phosphate aminotransferase (isomerizing)